MRRVEPSVEVYARLLMKTAINKRFQELYEAGMQSGRHGHYETMFAAMHQAYAEAIQDFKDNHQADHDERLA